MNIRHILPALGGILLSLLTIAPATAQTLEEATPVQSAKMEAFTASGIIHSTSGGDDMVAGAIYVKLRKGYGGASPSATVRGLASSAGLRTASATPIAFSQIPLSKDLSERIQSMPSEPRARVAEAEDNLNRLVEVYYTSGVSPREAARMVAKLPQVEYAEPIYIPHTLGAPNPLPLSPTNDPLIDSQTHLQQAKITDAWNIWKGDTNLIIAIVDAGIDMFHEDLAPNIKENPGEVGTDAHGQDKRTNGLDDDHNGVIDDWRGANLTADQDGTQPGNTKGQTHGTQVSGLAAATTNNGKGIAGAGYLCKFFPVKTALASGGSLIRAYEGIAYAARLKGVRVINCSFGGSDYSQALQDLITNLVTVTDCSILAGGGNAVMYTEFYPAGYEHVMGVGAIDGNNGFATTWGEQIGVSAPASFTTDDNNNYTPLGPATSYATPVASGVTGLIRSKFPALTADQALAHLRLTSDVLPTPAPDEYRLTGYGRINALRAVSTNPFSHPAVMIDSVWMIDDNGVPMPRAAVGKISRLRVRLRNILGPATNVNVRIRTYTSDSSIVSIKDTAISIAAIGTNEVKDIDGSIPFQVRQPSDSIIHLRFDITGDAGYVDYHYGRKLFYSPYITVRTPDIAVSLTDKGRIGFEDNPDNQIGDGFRFDNTQFLYEGGFIIASDPIRVMNNIRSAKGFPPDADFAPVEYPTSANNYTLTLNDAPATDRRIGLELRVRIVTSDTVPNGVAIQLRTRNITQGTIDSLRIALFMDWDLDSTDIGQAINYVPAPKTNVPFYGLVTNETGYYLAEGVASPAPLPIFFAIRNDSLPLKLYDGFTDDKKWYVVSNGIGQKQAVLSDSSDVSLVIGKRVVGLKSGAEDTTLFVIGVSTDRGEAVSIMHAMAPPAVIDTSVSGVADNATAGGGMLGTVQPNPFGGLTAITINHAARDAKLLVYDGLGRLVADLSDQLARTGAPSTLVFDGSRLPAGIYQLQILSHGNTETRQIVIIR